LSGYLLLAEKLYIYGSKYGEAWNFGPNDSEEKSVEWVIRQLLNNWGLDLGFKINACTTNPYEACYLKLDCSKARMQLGWKPQWNIAETIKRICDWHKAYISGQNMKTHTLDEINQYQSSILKI